MKWFIIHGQKQSFNHPGNMSHFLEQHLNGKVYKITWGDPSHPAPADIELDVPAAANLIDLTDLTSIAGWADMALVEARGYLGRTAENSQDLGISSMLRSSILDIDGLLRIPIRKEDGEYEGFDAGGVKLSVYDVTLVGLDSFTLFDILKATSPRTFCNSIKLQTFGVY